MLHTYISKVTPYESSESVKPLDATLQPRNINGPYYWPPELATLYGFPNDVNGAGQTVGIIELGGGYTMADLQGYLAQIGIQQVPTVVDVSVNGGVNNPADTSSATTEVCLDLDIVAAIAPGATIRMYFGPNAQQSSFLATLQQAVDDNCDIISISWGLAELQWLSSTRTAFNNLCQQAANKGITIFCAAGDNGASDGFTGLNVDFPGCSPYVVCCGGTTIQSAGGVITNETVWGNSTTSATGGGISAVFNKPTFQTTVPLLTTNTKRGVPDVAANANPNTGYIVRVGSIYSVVGGTSAVSPLLAALTALVNQKRLAAGKPKLKFINTPLYNAPLTVFRDIVSGNNFGYNAAAGWDFTTGLGSPSSDLTSYLVNYTDAVALFNATPISGTAPLQVTFTNTSTGTDTNTTYAWNFGNGSTSSQQNPGPITYNNAGTYTVALTVTKGIASPSSTTRTITVSAPAQPVVSSFNASTLSGTAPLQVTFTDTSTGSPDSWQWNFGNGSTSIKQVPDAVTYSNAGTYTVTLTVSKGTGAPSTSSKTITVSAPTQPVVSSFTASPLSGAAPLRVSFTSTSTGSPTAWLWNFGNGATSTYQYPGLITYLTAGTYTVTLRVTKGSDTSTSSKTITVTGNAPTTPPISVFSASTQAGTAPLTVTFTNSSTGNPTSFLWNFGNGTTSTLQTPSPVTYGQAGTYNVSLTVSNTAGSNTSTKSIVVTSPTPTPSRPVANFTFRNRTVTFTDTSTNSPTSWLWTFGDGSSSTVQNPTKTYVNAGTYTVTLKATNNGGFTTKTSSVTIY